MKRVVDRRGFIGGLALGTLAVPRVIAAQPTRKDARIGILGAPGDLRHRRAAA
jgi:hypothetical protein